jgi:sRNA-binding protein
MNTPESPTGEPTLPPTPPLDAPETGPVSPGEAAHDTPTAALGTPVDAPADAAFAVPLVGTSNAATDTSALPAAAAMSPAACGERLKALFPALFAGQAKPIKLRIQADIQARAPGEFTKAALSNFLRRHTGSTSYLIALTRASHRLDLDGQPAGEIADEHRQAANEELARRRALRDQRHQAEQQQRRAEDDARRERYQLLRAYQNTTLTRENFCALKGLTPDALDSALAQARREAEEWARQTPPPGRGRHPARRADGEHRPDRGPRQDGPRPPGSRRDARPAPRRDGPSKGRC